MYKGKRILAVVPARGGSKGVPQKNIHTLLGRPLIVHTAELIKSLPLIDCGIVSTDDETIARTSEAHGLKAPFRRPAEFSGDRVADYPVLRHALEEMERQDGVRYDAVIMLQPTSPLRRAAHVEACIKKLLDETWDAVWTVSPTDLKYHPLKQLTVGSDGTMDYWDARGGAVIARQELSPVYHRNGAAYALTRACLLDQTTIKGARSAAVVISEPMVSIDTLDDFEKVETLLRNRGTHP